MYDNVGFGTANGILGVDFWVAENLALSAQSTYKHSFEDNYGATHFQHTLGIKFKFGGKDTDGDGIYDYEDECPETPGLEEFNGCPDTDGDGIEDRNDECPNTPEFEINNIIGTENYGELIATVVDEKGCCLFQIQEYLDIHLHRQRPRHYHYLTD